MFDIRMPGKFPKTRESRTKTVGSRSVLLAATALGAMLVSGGAALATPTVTVNGVTIPLGIVAGGNQIDSSLLAETLVTKTGDVDTGVGIVNSISDPVSSNAFWHDGDNGVRLAFTFSYTANVVTPPTLTTGGQITFTGGTIDFYTLAAGTTINGLGSVAADVSAVTSGTLWLSATAAPGNAAGDTLVSTIPAGTNTISNFHGGSGFGFLDVTGGPAGGYYDTNTFANIYDISGAGGFSDATFTSDFSSGATGNFGVSGSATVKANTVPEPMSVTLLGLGLLGLAGAQMKRRR